MGKTPWANYYDSEKTAPQKLLPTPCIPQHNPGFNGWKW